MKKILLFLALATASFAETITLDNTSTYPNGKSKISVQWASSAKEVEEETQALLRGAAPNKLQPVTQSGKVKVTVSSAAAYFRILVWSKGSGQPDLLTNWVEIVPNKTYKLDGDHLFPAVLMSGSGC
jgi:hypothetical protein